MAKYINVEQVSDDFYKATIIPKNFIDKLKLAYLIMFKSDTISCNVIVSKKWFDANLTDKDVDEMNEE